MHEHCYQVYTIATVITAVLSAPNNITVTWTALPSTEYCVDINKTTLDPTETMVLDSVCGLANEYSFTYTNYSVCDRFSFTVTPTEGEMRGTTSEPVAGFFQTARGMYGALLQHPHLLLLHFYIVQVVENDIVFVTMGRKNVLNLSPL